jgi:predicted small lipoprotein YifL
LKKRAILMLTALAMAASMAACGDKKTDETAADSTEVAMTEAGTESTEAETESEEVLPEGMYRSELTNELIDESLKNQRPIAVMVDNESIALPHYGLSQADVVYEMMNSTLNGRITRFMVLVKDWENIKQLGSIRSVRPTNILIASEWNAVICHDGGPFYIDEYMADPSVDNFSGTFSREYTEYILPGDLDKNFENSGVSKEYTSYYEGPHYQFASESNPVDLSSASDAIDANTVDLPFPHNGSYLEYNADDQLYYYSEYGKAHVDPGNDNKQLCFKNLLIQSCGYTQYDEHGYLIFDCVSQGGGYYVTNGKAIPVTWKKEKMTSPTRYYDAAGNEIKINTGKTYVGFVPVDDWLDLVIE